MQSSPRIEELRQKFHENPRRYFAPLANEYRKAGDPEQAIAICRAHLAQQPGHMSGHVVYGQALYDARRMDEANTVFQRALALDPENIIVLRHLGDIARQRGDAEEARSWYSRALDGDPNDAETAAYLAELTEPLTTAPAAEPEVVSPETQPAAPEPEVVAAESRVPEPEAISPEPEPEAGALEAEAPEAEAPEAEAPEAEAQPSVPATVGAGPPEAEAAIELARELEMDTADEEPTPEEPLVSPYAREMELSAPAEMKWDLNDSPYLELVESVAPSETGDRGSGVSDTVGEISDTTPEVSDTAPEASDTTAEGSETAAHVAETVQPTVEEPELVEPALASEDETEKPTRRTPSRATAPVSESAPIVTRTLAELYLEQGYIEPALEIYRQLAEREPEDIGIQTRIDELTSEGESASQQASEEGAGEAAEPLPEAVPETPTPAAEAAPEAPPTAAEAAPEAPPTAAEAAPEAPPTAAEAAPEAPPTPAEEPPTSAFEPVTTEEPSAATVTSEGEAEPEEHFWDSADAWGDRPFIDSDDRDEIFGLAEEIEESGHAPVRAETPPPPPEPRPGTELEPEPEPEPKPDAREARPVTVREFFATLGAVRIRDSEQDENPVAEDQTELPPAESKDESGEQQAYPITDDAFGNLFAGIPVSAEDSRAAAALSGAVAHGSPFSTPLPSPPAVAPRASQPTQASSTPAQESEEDIRRFREWLDGLAES